MNDRYLFRGKRLINPEYTQDTGEWTYGYYTKKVRCTRDGAILKIDAIEDVGKIDGAAYAIHHEIDPATLNQSTGLKDKNGTLIFEGDVVEFTPVKTLQRAVVRYRQEHGSLVLAFNAKADDLTGDRWDTMHPHEYVVIGNVHDNPELLNLRR